MKCIPLLTVELYWLDYTTTNDKHLQYSGFVYTHYAKLRQYTYLWRHQYKARELLRELLMWRQALFLLPFHFLVQHLMSVNKLRVQRSEERNDERKTLKKNTENQRMLYYFEKTKLHTVQWVSETKICGCSKWIEVNVPLVVLLSVTDLHFFLLR